MTILNFTNCVLTLALIVIILNEKNFYADKIERLNKRVQLLERRVTIQEKELTRMQEKELMRMPNSRAKGECDEEKN